MTLQKALVAKEGKDPEEARFPSGDEVDAGHKSGSQKSGRKISRACASRADFLEEFHPFRIFFLT